jgi:hypothetical protein
VNPVQRWWPHLVRTEPEKAPVPYTGPEIVVVEFGRGMWAVDLWISGNPDSNICTFGTFGSADAANLHGARLAAEIGLPFVPDDDLGAP